ncbi:glycoside hydrolase family 28 protein [Gaoshiqia sp. Z1-71]|uniref:glycoside hydrolase family 28 protein n=1 Tax=Gaoshiqia hydrogeniformans TaxID=3290090 RepID=UPI003BF83C3B
MKKTVKSFILLLLSINLYAQQGGWKNVLVCGAKADNESLNTEIIRGLIETTAAEGGGTIYFPAGNYLTGPIHLKSNITLYLEAGATLRFTDDFDAYLPMVPSRWEGTDVVNFSPLIYAYQVENITIAGRGTLDGQGKKWWDYHHFLYAQPKDFKSKWQQLFAENNPDVLLPDEPDMITRGFCRPPFIQPMYCSNIRIEGITIVNSPFWTVNPQFCENITLEGVTINNPKSPNTDGINPESCRYVHISNCHISVGDDCITIKSGKDRSGRKMAAPCENITITNCTMLRGHGGVVIGSEMSGDVKKVTITNCVFEGTDRGIRIKSTRGRGGVVEDIRVSNIIMKDIREAAIILNMYYRQSEYEEVSERTPAFRNIHFSGITGNAKQAGLLLGLEELPVSNISFTDIRIKGEIGFTVKDAQDISFHNVQMNATKGPALSIEKSKYVEVNAFSSNSPLKNTPVIQLDQVEQLSLINCYQPRETDIFIQKSKTCKDLFIRNNILPKVRKKILVTK